MRSPVWSKLKVLFGALLVTLFTVSLMIFPAEGVKAAVAGLRVFWEVVLPSLLPFFVLSEILLGMGVVHFLGVLLEPLMRPLFNVPGIGAFALSMGLAAGYPMDAVITGKFRRSGMCTRVEGERLLSFTNTADPLFIFGAVAVGMFGRPDLGAVMAIAHYVSSFSVGVAFKFYKKSPASEEQTREVFDRGMLRRAVRALFKARRDDGRPIGRLFGDAVKESITTLLMIGGFITLFAVLVKMMDVFKVMGAITPLLGGFLRLCGLDPDLAGAVFNGVLEIDLGTMVASTAAAPVLDKVMIASWIIAWSGLSVHCQVASVIHDTDIGMGPYVAARFLHGVFAAFYTWILMGPLAPVLAPLHRAVAATRWNPIDRLVLSGQQMLAVLGILLLASLAVYISKRYALVWVKK
jgi:sporulation integral membrane protein YlbJ